MSKPSRVLRTTIPAEPPGLAPAAGRPHPDDIRHMSLDIDDSSVRAEYPEAQPAIFNCGLHCLGEAKPAPPFQPWIKATKEAQLVPISLQSGILSHLRLAPWGGCGMMTLGGCIF